MDLNEKEVSLAREVMSTPFIHLQALTFALTLKLAMLQKRDPIEFFHQLLAESERELHQIEDKIPDNTIAI